jgi:hypothetical protein
MKALQRIAKKGYLKPLEMLGKPVADLSLPSTGGGTFKLSSARGAKRVLYFHPEKVPVRAAPGRGRDRVQAVRRDQDEDMYGTRPGGIELC